MKLAGALNNGCQIDHTNCLYFALVTVMYCIVFLRKKLQKKINIPKIKKNLRKIKKMR